MAAPAEQLAQILTDALNQWVKDNPDLFKLTVTETGGGDGSGGGGGGVNPFSLLEGLGALALLTNPEIGAIIETLKTGTGQAGQTAEGFGVGWVAGSAVFLLLEPYLRIVQHLVENEAQSQILDPNTAAELASKGIISDDFGKSEAGGNGFDAQHWNWLADAAKVRPPWDISLQLWNRGLIGEDDVNTTLRYAGIPEFWWPYLKDLHRQLLSPADLALAALRGHITEQEGVDGAKKFGVDETDFQTLLLNTGEPPGLQQLDEAYRREFIDRDRLVRGIRQSRVRDEWIDVIEKLRFAPMSTAQAANAVVRGYITEDEGASKAQQNGLEPADWKPLLESNGRPLSHEQMTTLYHRGLVSLDEVKQAIRESDVKNKYIEGAIELGVKYPALFELVNLYKNGEIDAAYVTKVLLAEGYEREFIDQIVKSAHKGKTPTAKHLSQADYTELYDAAAISRHDAIDGLVSLGYTEHDAGIILDVADTRAQTKIVTSQITNVRQQFDRFRITEQQAREKLDKIGLPKTEVDRLLNAWVAIRPDGVKQLTEAQVMKVHKDGLIDDTDALNRLRALGYNQGDSELLLQVYG